MQPSWQNVLDSARAALNDNYVSGGVQWSNTRLQEHAARAYRKMYDAMGGIAANRIRHTVYFVMPANTTIWQPVPNLITDMAEPEVLSERSVSATGAITDTSNTTPIDVTTTAPHNLGANGAVVDVMIGQVVGTYAPWGRWWATVTGASDFNLNGSVTDGAGGTGGTWSTSSDKFVDLIAADYIVSNRDINESLVDYTWENNVLNFRGASTQRQVKLIYVASGTAPTNSATVINIDNCLNFLSTAAACYADRSVGLYERADYYEKMAYGLKGEADASGGMLRDLVAPIVLELQRESRWPKTFRPNRNSSVPFWS